MNLYVCNKFCQNEFFVDHANKFYNYSRNILGILLKTPFKLYYSGQNITSYLIRNTMSKAFTAGEQIEDLERLLSRLNAKGIYFVNTFIIFFYLGIPAIIDYASEALHGVEPSESV